MNYAMNLETIREKGSGSEDLQSKNIHLTPQLIKIKI
jgi:hypothetical protein